MKLIYLTAKKYPALTADHNFIKEMSKAFASILGDNFLFAATDIQDPAFESIPHQSFDVKIKHGLTLYYFFKLPLFIRKNGFQKSDVVFFSNDPNLLLILIFWKKVLGLKYKIASDWHMLFDDWRDGVIARHSDVLITTTNHLKNILIERTAVNGSKILTVYGGVDLEAFEGIQKKELHSGSFVVGYVGLFKTLGLAKGIDTMIDALALIDDPQVTMAFVGGKPAEIEEYSALAKEKGVENRVKFVPIVPAGELVGYEKSMDLLVIPYPNQPHFREYGFPMKVYEYMASGVPILFSNLPIMAEVLDPFATSFEPSDAQDLANKIVTMKQRYVSALKTSLRAMEKVREYTWVERAGKIISSLKGI